MDLWVLLRILDLNMVKNFWTKESQHLKKIKNTASKFNQSKYGKILKNQAFSKKKKKK